MQRRIAICVLRVHVDFVFDKCCGNLDPTIAAGGMQLQSSRKGQVACRHATSKNNRQDHLARRWVHVHGDIWWGESSLETSRAKTKGYGTGVAPRALGESKLIFFSIMSLTIAARSSFVCSRLSSSAASSSPGTWGGDAGHFQDYVRATYVWSPTNSRRRRGQKKRSRTKQQV